MLEVRSLTVTYGVARAVDGLSFRLGDGEVVALLGANGAGKTSSLRAISGLIPWHGEVSFDGQSLAGLAATEIARRGLIQVPEGRRVIPTLSVHENLQLGRVAAAGRAGRFGFDDVYSLLPALVPLRRRLGYSLSGGEQQMVAIGRALLAAPRLLLLDEPSLGLAPVVVRAVYRILAEVSRDTPILLVEQNTDEALRLAQRALVLGTGTLRLEGTSEEIRGRADLLNALLGRSDTESEASALGGKS